MKLNVFLMLVALVCLTVVLALMLGTYITLDAIRSY